MLSFSSQQMTDLRSANLRIFEQQMAEHLRAFSPPLCETLTDEQLTAAIQYGMHRAREQHFDQRGPTRMWLENALLFGSDYHSDPQYPWVRDILTDPDPAQMQRAKNLYNAVLDYRKEVGGKADELTLAALGRIRPAVDALPELTVDNFYRIAMGSLTKIYPEKAKRMGQPALQSLVGHGIETSAKYGVTSLRGQFLIVTLLYAFGHRCDEDPLYPWIKSTLVNERFPDPNARADKLERKALIWLDRVLSYFDGEVSS